MFMSEQDSASDGCALLLIDAMLEISRVILDPENKKWGLIDPDFMAAKPRYKLAKYQPLNSTVSARQSSAQDFGTVSEFFFTCMELMSVSFLPCLNKLIRMIEGIEKLEKELKKGQPYMRERL